MKNKLLLIAMGIALSAQTLMAQVPSYVPTDGLVGYWPFSGNANDESGNGNNGVVNGATLTTDRFGNVNSAYSFDGSDWIEVFYNQILNFGTNSFTLSCWSIKQGNNTFQHLITRNYVPQWPNAVGNYALRYQNNTIVLFSSGNMINTTNGTLVTSPQNNLNNWNHFVGVYNSTNQTMQVYMNGNMIATGSINSNLQDYDSIGNMYFGVEHPTTALPSGPQFLTGKIDDIAIYNRALTFSEVQLLYTGCSTSAPTGNASQTLCPGSTVADLTATGTNIKWYSASTGGTALASTTALINGTTYYASQTVNGCESTTRLAVVVTVITSNPQAVSVNSQTICQGMSASIAATPSTPGSYSYIWTCPTGATNPGDVASFNTSVPGTYIVEVSDQVCFSTIASGVVTLNNPTVSASATTVCSGQPTTLTASSGASTTSNFSVGSIGPSGGYVFYDKGSVTNGWRYLEAAPSNIQNSSWGCGDVNIAGATSLSIGSGLTNTNAIVTTCTTPSIAAKRCLDHSVNGYDDWYLPSQNEFAQIYQNLIVNNLGNFNVGPIPTQGTLYWTSTQLTAGSGSHCCLECSGNFYQYSKIYELYVRPVRQFASGTPFSSYLWSTGATTASISVNPTSTTQYWVDVTSNGVTFRKNITITVNSTTSSPTGSTSQTFCSGATVANLTATGTNIQWYSASTDGTVLASTTALVNGTTYYASQTVSGCESTNRLAVTVSFTAQPNAGLDGSTAVCESSASIDLFFLIVGEQAGGVWTRISGTGGTFNPLAGTFTPSAGAASSTFEYRIAGAPPCADDFSIATIIISAQPNAGLDGSVTVCDSSVPIDLNPLITGEQTGGVWTRTSGLGGTFNAAAGTYVTAVGASSSTFTYTLTGVAPCVNDTAVATIYINPHPDAGDSATTNICSNSDPVDLRLRLGGTPQDGGVWTPLLASGTGLFIPNIDVAGVYNYSVGAPFCTPDVATLTVNIVPGAEAGNSGAVTFCKTTDGPQDLFLSLGGSPQIGGVWTPTLASGTGVFSPWVDVAGVYTYTLSGNQPCGNDAATVNVSVDYPTSPSGANNQTVSQGSTLANLLVTGQDIQWYANPFGGTPLPLNTPLVSGTTYYASQTINGCESQYRLPVIVQLTLSNDEFGSIGIVYNPNPVIDILNIKASTILKNAKICNVLGQTIFQQSFNSYDIQLNMSDVPSGTYFVIVEADNRKETFKVLKN